MATTCQARVAGPCCPRNPHPTPPDSTHPQLTPEENREHTREAQRPMPEDADQDILERLVCLWPTTRSNRAKLICQVRGAELVLSWGLGWQYSFWQSFRRLFFCAVQRAFLGQLRALKGRSRTADLGFKEILRRIYFKVCMFGFDSSTPCLLLSGSNLDASLTPQSKAAVPDTDPTARQPPLNARVARSPLGELRA